MSSRVSRENKLCSRGIALCKSFMVLLPLYLDWYCFVVIFLFFFENLNTSEHGLSACTGNNLWYYKGILRKSGPGGGEKGVGGGEMTRTVKYSVDLL